MDMDKTKVSTTLVDERVYYAKFDDAQIKQALVDLVAQAAGVDMQAPNMRVRRAWLRSQDRGDAGTQYSAEIEIVEDLLPPLPSPSPAA